MAEISDRRGVEGHRRPRGRGRRRQRGELSHYPASVERVVAMEFEDHLRRQAERAAASVPVQITVLEQDRALAGLFRAIRPVGELRFYEHVLARETLPARLQRFAEATFWPRAVGGCHLTRETGASIRRAGFVVEGCERYAFGPGPLPTLPYLLGVTRWPD